MNRRTFTASSAAAIAAAVSPTRSLAGATGIDFRFRSSFWQNLHHTLYYQAQVLETIYGAGSDKLSPIDDAAYRDLQKAASADRATWFRALRMYHDHYASLSFVFDDGLMNADNAIAGDEAQALSMKVPAPMRDALMMAAPVYRHSLWSAHDASNRAFIVGLKDMVQRYNATIAGRLARIYGTPWLAQPYVVDVAQYAEWEGSYSNNAADFVHIVMSAKDPDEHAMAAVDILFHEASHSIADPKYGTIGSAITAEVQRLDRPSPDQFWHALIMYTPGKISEELASAGSTPYTMVWMQPGLFGHRWPRYYRALEAHWLPYMRGKGTLREAVARCVAEITAEPG